MVNWARHLSGTRPHGAEQEWLGPDGARVRREFGDAAVAWALDVGEAVANKIGKEVPQLAEGAAQFGVLRRATTSTTLRALTLVTGVGEAEATLVSTEVVEIAQDFARRGLELNALLQSIRIGYAVLAGALLDAVIDADRQDTTELRRVSILMFEMMDNFTGTAATAFLDEQRAWEAHITAARLDLVRTIIDGEPVDADLASRTLDYPLSGDHVALIASTDPSRSRDRIDLRNVVEPVVRQWGAPHATLIVPVGAHALWAWAAIAPSAAPKGSAALPVYDTIDVAVGQPGRGIDGFRRTHREAQAVEHLRALSGRARPTSIAHHNVDLEALLLADPEAGQQFATRYLGPLAGTDARATELRDTLKLYLDHDHSISKVAAIKHIARNTVTDRIQQALDLCGHDSQASSLRLRSALLIADWLDQTDHAQ
jgi:DNA-binding PucR family transcriptional regulator